jgi:hypothetical protein
MDLLSFLDPNRESKEFFKKINKQLQDTALTVAMIEQGWTPIPEGMSEEQQQAAIDTVRKWGKVDLYPPGYVEPPVITEGKLQVEPKEEEPERQWWQFW